MNIAVVRTPDRDAELALIILHIWSKFVFINEASKLKKFHLISNKKMLAV
jgi:hypothetical protein